MKFYDRTTELEILRESLLLSRNESQMTVVMGRRRIGKTELAKRIGDDTSLYFSLHVRLRSCFAKISHVK